MIRNVVTVKLRPDADPGRVEALVEAFRRMDCPGTLSYTAGTDAGLREGNWSLAIVADFADVDSYRGYDADAEHDRLRAELAPLAEGITRVQLELPDSPGPGAAVGAGAAAGVQPTLGSSPIAAATAASDSSRSTIPPSR